jgi:hypothetical protein
MQVQARDDRYVWPDEAAHSCEQFAFGVFAVLGDHCAVQAKEDSVDRERGSQVLDEHPCNALERVFGDITRWCSGRPRERQKGRAGRPEHLKGARDRGIHAAEALEHLRPARKRRAVAGLGEVRVGRPLLLEGVGLVQETTHRDALVVKIHVQFLPRRLRPIATRT